mmetsp:Transcript_40502/g.105075  ORF Transcript_40502/g.105075 Transcript_40502/m.105075 type:complete len:159 (+) Transcript_40502:2323-2799(+)
METKNVQNRQRFPRKGERFGLSVPPPLIENIPRKEDAEGEGTLIAKTERFSFKEVLAPCLGFPSASLLCLFRPFLVSVPFFCSHSKALKTGNRGTQVLPFLRSGERRHDLVTFLGIQAKLEEDIKSLHAKQWEDDGGLSIGWSEQAHAHVEGIVYHSV